MNSQLEQYIQNHKVSTADILIFRDCEEFLNVLFFNNCRVEMIVWYEYCRINEQKIGMADIKTLKISAICGQKHIFLKLICRKNL